MRERVARRYFADRRKDFRSLPVGAPPPPPPTIAVDRLWTGVPTATTASCSVKTASVADTVRMVVSTSSDLSSPIYGPTAAPDSTFRLAKASVSGLTPNTQYYYAIDVNGAVDTAKKGQFKTPASGAHSFSFAFGSCSIVGDVTSFNAIKARNPAFFMHLGDFFYDDLYATYGGALAESHYQAVFDSQIAARGDFHYALPNCYNWSEHDYLGGFGGRDAAGNPHSKRNVPIDAFRRRVPVPLASATDEDPVYFSFVYGRCRFVVVDTMADYQYVGPLDSSAANTCLGATQKAWVKAEVAAAAAAGQVVFLAVENPWKADNPGASGSATNWMGFIAERIDLTDYFVSVGMAGKVIILAGDSHAVMVGSSDYSTAGRTFKQPNFQAAPLHQGRSVKGGPWDTVPYPQSSVGQYQQYGLVDVVDTGSAITVTFTGYNAATGATILSPVSINMSDRDVPPDFYSTATRSATGAGTSLAAVAVPSNTGLNGLRVAIVATKNNDVHTCPTAGWSKVTQNDSSAFSVSVWIAAESAAAPTFNWTNSTAGYARISTFASPTGALVNGVLSSSAVGGIGASIGGPALANSVQDSLIVGFATQAQQHTLNTPFWSKFSDIGSSTADVELTIGGRRMSAVPCHLEDIAWTGGGTGAWVLHQLELAVA